jgi:AraC-like DNA-binding protein/mannose-6-phosphate isomerase-like protein (cupin superfamily)
MGRNVYFVDLEYNDARIRFFDFEKTNTHSFEDPYKQWHTHIYYELHFSFENTVTIKFKDRELTVNPGELLIIPPSVMHESIIYDSSSKDYKVLSIEIEKTEKGEDFYNAFINALNTYALKPIKIHDINKQAVFSFGNKKLYDSLFGICQLKMYASEVICALFKNTLKDKPVTDDYNKVKIIIDYMLSYPQVTLGEIAEATNYSQRQISRIIKEQYGTTFSEIRQRIKNNEKNINNK